MHAVLSISGARVSHDCAEVVAAMLKSGIHGDVTPNTTVLDGDLERGCRVLVVGADARRSCQRLWTTLKSNLVLECAHVHVAAHSEDGCVYDVFRPSQCPGNPQK